MLTNVQPLDPRLLPLLSSRFRFKVLQVITSLHEWAESPASGPTSHNPDDTEHSGVVVNQGVQTAEFRYGIGRTAEILVIWHPIRGKAVSKDTVGATMTELYILVVMHGVVEMARLELWELGVMVGVVQLAVIPDPRRRPVG